MSKLQIINTVACGMLKSACTNISYNAWNTNRASLFCF